MAVETVRLSGIEKGELRHTFSRVGQVCNSFGHDDGHVEAAFKAIHAELDEDVVQHMLHDIPVADYTRPSLKCVADVSSCCRVGIAVLSCKGEGLAELAVAILGHDGRNG
jgi:hypothetical protein